MKETEGAETGAGPEPSAAAELSGYVPGRHLLEAALRTAACLDFEGQYLTHFRSSLHHVPTDGLFTSDHLRSGEEILVRARLASRDDGVIRLTGDVPDSVELLAVRYIEESPPPWLGAATRNGDLDPTLIPDEDAATLEDVLGDPDRRDALLLALGKRFDDEFRSALGRAGEEAVVEQCRRVLVEAGHPGFAEEVLHASLISDQLGYDVRTPQVGGDVLRLEVKTEASSGEQVRFYLSRNEWETGRRDPAWRLVVCSRGPGGQIAVTGWLPARDLETFLPTDNGGGRWQSVEVSLPSAELLPGLPDLVPDEPPLLNQTTQARS